MLASRGLKILKADATTKPAIVATQSSYTLHVIFHVDDDKVGIKVLRDLMDQIGRGEFDALLVVSRDGPTPFTRRDIGNATNIEFFCFSELQIDLMKFAIVPRHTALTKDEIDEVKKRYHIDNNDKWPKLRRTDPVARYYNWEPGTVVRIDRAWGSESTPYYRIVVN